MTTSRAAVCVATDADLEITEVDVEAPQAGEVLVRLAASGVCHTDLSVARGHFPYELPIVLGHEGAGVVEAVGPDVDHVQPGDHVVLAFNPQCGECLWCRKGQPQLCAPGQMAAISGGMADHTPRFSRNGRPVRQMASLGTFSELLVAQAGAAIKIPADVPFPVAALIGCGVLTGVGAAVNTAAISPGDTVGVIGCGGVGLSAIQGALLAGAERVIAIDRLDTKLELAKQFGATDVLDAGAVDVPVAVADLTGGVGVDVAFEVVGLPVTAQQALAITRRGGQACFVGMPAVDVVLEVPMALEFTANEKRLLGCTYGSSDVRRDVPRILEWWNEGRLRISELVSATIGLDDVNQALATLDGGSVARSVIVFSDTEVP